MSARESIGGERGKAPKAASSGQEPKRRIGEMLIDEDLITEKQLDEALARNKEHGGKTVENLIALNYLDPHAFVRFLSKQPGVASIDLLNYTIPTELLELVPADYAFKHELLPIDRLGRDLTVGMACPLDQRTIEELEGMVGLRVRPLLVSMGDIRAALSHYYGRREAAVYNLEAEVELRMGTSRPGTIPKKQASQAPEAPRQSEATSPEAAEPPPAEPAKPAPLEEAKPPPAEAGGIMPRIASALTFESAMHLVREVTSLPALPETVSQVREAMENPETTVADLSQIIQRDPSVSAKVLSLANSSAYSFRHRVDSVEQAAALLGIREIYSVVLSAAVIDYFDKSTAMDYKAFWKQSMVCATAAKVVGHACGRKGTQGLSAAGLLHDIGRAVFAELSPEKYAQLDHNQTNDALIAQEHEFFGLAHPEVGHLLAESWELPSEIAIPIRFHHNVSLATEHQDLVAIIALAANMADAYGRMSRAEMPAFVERCQPATELLGIDEAQLATILTEAGAAIREALS